VTELLTHLARTPQPGARAHAEHLLTDPGRSAPASVPAVLTAEEGLSDRELEVLRLLASELSGPDIARHLFISVNTLRTHTKHIFTKLDVKTRRAAVLRAGDLGLF
jgi:LuxR family maltose regulon positive regulatory protein